jgi:hypothetical protein
VRLVVTCGMLALTREELRGKVLDSPEVLQVGGSGCGCGWVAVVVAVWLW